MQEQIIFSLLCDMIAYEQGTPHRIQHFLKVHAFARIIGHQEHLDEATQQTLELASIVHDIGIKPSLVAYNSSAGPYQQLEGPPVARNMLSSYDLPKEMVDRICYLIAHHHTYTNMDGLDYRILVEADFLVNLFEDKAQRPAIESALHHCFTTETGRTLLKQMFLSTPA